MIRLHIPDDPTEAQVWALVNKLIVSDFSTEAHRRGLKVKNGICWRVSDMKIVVYIGGIGYHMWHVTECPLPEMKKTEPLDGWEEHPDGW